MWTFSCKSSCKRHCLCPIDVTIEEREAKQGGRKDFEEGKALQKVSTRKIAKEK